MENANISADTATVSAEKVVVPSSGTQVRNAVMASPVIPSENSDRVDDRRDWALYTVIVAGGLMVLFSTIGLFHVRTQPNYTFYLSLAAMVNLMVVITGLLGLLVKRSLVVSRTGIEIKDHGSDDQQS